MSHLHKLNMVGLLAVLFGLAACEDEPPAVEEVVRTIKTMTVTELASGRVRKYSGVVQATDSSSLGFQVAGNVNQVAADIGDQVSKGQVLAVLDTRPYELNVQGAEAELQKVQSDLQEKQLEYDRQARLFEKEWVSQAALDQARSAYESARASLNFAQSKLNLARRDLRLTTLTAPFAGVIATREVEPFMDVAAGQVLFEINAEGALEASFTVPETTIAQITLGSPVTVAFPTERGSQSEGRITKVGSAAAAANAFPVNASLIDAPASIRAGMTAEISVVLRGGQEDSGYLVPIVALAPGSDRVQRGHVFVFDPASSTVVKTPISARGAADNMVSVFEGLEAGDVIAVAGVSFLTDGQKVRLMAP